jgi:uncharacterized protein GlcG (DUF336 family)
MAVVYTGHLPEKKEKRMIRKLYSTTAGGLFTILALAANSVLAAPHPHPEHPEEQEGPNFDCKDLPTHDQLAAALNAVVTGGGNAGFGLDMWATIVTRDGVVCSVAFSGKDRGDQWPGSRVISAQKANTANAFSLPTLALSTANLYSAVQPGGTLFGLQESNPVDPEVAYQGPSKNYGQPNDPMVGQKIGGINVFGGGLALYTKEGKLVGGLGVSGDTSCTDHIIAWKMRHMLNLDNVPKGVSPTSAKTAQDPTGTDDNIIYDIKADTNGHPVSDSGWGHPICGPADEQKIAKDLPTNFPIGPNP